jgi:hypothetical protein
MNLFYTTKKCTPAKNSKMNDTQTMSLMIESLKPSPPSPRACCVRLSRAVTMPPILSDTQMEMRSAPIWKLTLKKKVCERGFVL